MSGLALILNLAGLFWGLPARWHPDEKADVVLGMARERRLAPDSFINPSLPLYAMLPAVGLQDRLAQAGLLHGLAADPLVVGRALSALAGAGAVFVLGLAGWRHAPSSGLLPPLLLALSPGVVNLCHFATPEAWLLLGTAITLSLALDHADGRTSVLALGFALGLTASTKYTAAALLAPAVLAVWLRPRGEAGRRDRVALVLAGVLLVVAGLVLVGGPGAALGARLHLKDARLLHPEQALGFVRSLGRALVLGGAGLASLAVLGAVRSRGVLHRVASRLGRGELVSLLLAAGFGFLLGTPFAALRPLEFLSDLAFNAQTRLEYKGLRGETTSFLPYARLLGDALTLPVLVAGLLGLLLAITAARRRRKTLIVALALAAPYLLVAASGHRAMRFLAVAWPAAAWLAASVPGAIPDRRTRLVAQGALLVRTAAAALLVTRLFFVDSRILAARYLEANVPPGETVDLIANDVGYAPTLPEGRTLRRVSTLSREMAPVAVFVEAARRYPERGRALARAHRVLLSALPRARRPAAGARRFLHRPARGTRGVLRGGALPPGGVLAAGQRVLGSGDRCVAEEVREHSGQTNNGSESRCLRWPTKCLRRVPFSATALASAENGTSEPPGGLRSGP